MVGFELAFLGGARTRSATVTATLLGKLVEGESCGGQVKPMATLPLSKSFRSPLDSGLHMYIASGTAGDDVQGSAGSLTVECTISVVRDPEVPEPICLPAFSGNLLQRQLGELLQSEVGADVTFAVSGESFAAHKNILAARSLVFKAEFFGEMQKKTTQHVGIKDMDAQVFRAMLRFIYTDMVPEFDGQEEEAVEEEVAVMAQHLLVAADRYGLDGLKVVCEKRLTLGVGIDTVASTLALAEQHNCPWLKAKCIEFIAGSPENIDAVVATDGYRHLEASSPWVLTELLNTALRIKE
ncbi:unnamed protein product [Urochloa humidicola]